MRITDKKIGQTQAPKSRKQKKKLKKVKIKNVAKYKKGQNL